MKKISAKEKRTLTTRCEECYEDYEVTEKFIFNGGSFSKYATRCPVCSYGKALPSKDVEKVFGEVQCKIPIYI